MLPTSIDAIEAVELTKRKYIREQSSEIFTDSHIVQLVATKSERFLSKINLILIAKVE
jgi:hypothetical protein